MFFFHTALPIKNYFQIYLFDPKIGPYHVLTLRVRVNLGVMVLEGYSTLLELLSGAWLLDVV